MKNWCERFWPCLICLVPTTTRWKPPLQVKQCHAMPCKGKGLCTSKQANINVNTVTSALLWWNLFERKNVTAAAAAAAALPMISRPVNTSEWPNLEKRKKIWLSCGTFVTKLGAREQKWHQQKSFFTFLVKSYFTGMLCWVKLVLLHIRERLVIEHSIERKSHAPGKNWTHNLLVMKRPHYRYALQLDVDGLSFDVIFVLDCSN